MYFLISGEMRYNGTATPQSFFISNSVWDLNTRTNGKGEPEDDSDDVVLTPQNKSWIAEAAIWTSDWVYIGNLRATSDCELLALDALTFQELIGNTQADFYARAFAEWYVNGLNEMGLEDLSDIGTVTKSMHLEMVRLFPNHCSYQGNNFRSSRLSVVSHYLDTLHFSYGKEME